MKILKKYSKIFLEIIIGIGFDKEAIKILKKKKNVRIIDASNLKINNFHSVVSNFNSFLFQSPDNKIFSKNNFKIVSKRKPNKKILNNLIFAFNVCRNVKSNAVVLTKDESTVGIGTGQPSRLDSCKIAIEKMNKFYRSGHCYKCFWESPLASQSIFKPELCMAHLGVEERDLAWEKKFQLA